MAVERLSDNRRELAARAVGMAAVVARDAARTWARMAQDDLPELRSAAFWGAVRAASSWDPDKGPFEYWARLHARAEIREFLSKRARRRRRKPPPCHLEYAHSVPDDRGADTDRVDAEDRFDALVRGLPTQHRDLCVQIYRHGLSLTDAALAVGLSKSRACRVHQEALAMLRSDLEAA